MAVTVYNWRDVISGASKDWKIISYRETGYPSFLKVKGHCTEKSAVIEPKPEYNSMLYSLKPSYIIGENTDTVSWKKVAHTTERRVKVLTKFLKKKKDKIRAKGIIYKDHTFSVDEKSLGALLREKQAADLGIRVDGSAWKTKTGWIPLTNEEVSDVYTKGYRYVASCFNRENILLVQIRAALTDKNFEDIDLDSGWPVQEIITEITTNV